ncbi:facilitated trehalose transporter Tret1-2 homolog [Penaeus monodon]|uniref:facilitated trehalose transporter Tret1-2 homolog n=1 Tax=Penaeus monodon TaxID=6687 RepID=UPI0018A6F423|nr:facilitated trehalose transporter Tret1-2 homolog [Penaeus monodon]XP_037774880.1 facilitated trehalose transporter Tret1-2 homolog [Penaeus monodon]XP_037774882.1 facilitated trehalose transporter Tret1-2 homolog [Penaeus monodon]XP_037774888.1 facilitated trehalose transporter Tret1-2 homolog [Penaeus monodon]
MLKWLRRGPPAAQGDAEGFVMSERPADASLPQEEETTPNGRQRHEEEAAPRRGTFSEDDRHTSPDAAHQVLAALTSAFVHLGIGSVLGFSGVTLPELTDPVSPDLFLNTSQAALFSSVVNLGAAVGSTAAGAPQVWLGQRVMLLLTLPVSLAAWLLMAAAPKAWMVIAARALQGLTMGFLAGSSNNYVVELAHTKFRGLLMAMLDLSRQLGYLLVYATGSTSLSWRQVARVCGVVTHLLPLLGLLCLPNSPRWLAAQGRLGEARVALKFFRGRHYNCDQEMADIAQAREEGRCSPRSQLQEMKNPEILCRIVLLALLLFISNFTGNFVVSAYVVPIFEAAEVVASPYAAAVIIGCVRVVGTLLYLAVVDRADRKVLLVSSTLVCAASMALLGSFFYDHENSDDVSHQRWLPLASLAAFTLAASTAFPVLSLFRSEILPTSVRATAVAFLYSVFFIGAFSASQSYPGATLVLGHHGTFWTYSAFAVLVAAVGGLALPETRGQSLEQISGFQNQRLRNHANGDASC